MFWKYMILYRYKGLFISLITTLIIVFFSLTPANDVGNYLIFSDKLIHFIAYTLMVLPLSLDKNVPYVPAFFVGIFLSVITEYVQPLWRRESDLGDIVANIAGITIGLVIVGLIKLFCADYKKN